MTVQRLSCHHLCNDISNCDGSDGQENISRWKHSGLEVLIELAMKKSEYRYFALMVVVEPGLVERS